MSELTEDKGAPDGGPASSAACHARTGPDDPTVISTADLRARRHVAHRAPPPGLFSVRFGSGTGESGAAAVLFDGSSCPPTSCSPARLAATR